MHDSTRRSGRNRNSLFSISTATFGAVAAALVLLDAGIVHADVATQVTVGAGHACAVNDTGGVLCWGRNLAGEVGDGTTTLRTTPVAVTGLSSGVASVDVGDSLESTSGPYATLAYRSHSCAVTTSGTVKCWGLNHFGALGDGTIMSSTVPVDVAGLSGIVQVAAGGWHTCALAASGAVACWGWNDRGQLGDGSLIDSLTPVAVAGLSSGVVAIAVGPQHGCALTTAGGVKCWGANASGQLGNGTTTDSSTPVDVTTLSTGVQQISAGGEFADFGHGETCALTVSGGVKCWGQNNAYVFGTTPGDVDGLTSGVAAVSVGPVQSAALMASGAIRVFRVPEQSYEQRFLTSGMASAAAGGDLCGLTTTGEIQCAHNFSFLFGRGTVESAIFDGGCVLGFGDDDGDGLCDVYDSCTNVAGGGVFAARPRPSFAISRTGSDPTPGDEQLTLSARFALPAGTAFGDLDPVGSGITIELVNADGVLGTTILGPGSYTGIGSAGWLAVAHGKTWQFIDATGGTPSAVVVRASLTDRGKGLDGGTVDIRVTARRQTLPIVDLVSTPAMLTVVLGDAAAGAAGICAQSTSSRCSFTAAKTKFTCR